MFNPQQASEVWEDYNLCLSKWCVHIPFPSYMDSDEYLNSYVQNS